MRPRKVVILGQSYVVKYIKLPDTWGECRNDTMEILIDKDLVGKALIQTVFHEMVHAAFWRTGLNLVIDESIEEVTCEVLSNVFADLWDITQKE